MLELKHIQTTRIVARPADLDAATWPQDAIVMRVARDEVLAIANVGREIVSDPYAIVESDEGFAAVWISAAEAQSFLERTCEWELPHNRPAFAQGAVANLPLKLWFEQDRVLFVVPGPYAVDLQEYLRGAIKSLFQ